VAAADQAVAASAVAADQAVAASAVHGVSNTYCRGIESVYRAKERAV
jgi:hypothetical protein